MRIDKEPIIIGFETQCTKIVTKMLLEQGLIVKKENALVDDAQSLGANQKYVIDLLKNNLNARKIIPGRLGRRGIGRGRGRMLRPLADRPRILSDQSFVRILASNGINVPKTPADKGPSEGSTSENGNSSSAVWRKPASRISTYIKREEDRFDGTLMELMELRDRK